MPAPDIAREVAFLANPANHIYAPRAVRVIETHLSWVFLTDLHAYKLKKVADGSVARREAQVRNEIALNRRLARDTYLGAVPIARNERGELQLDQGGEPLDWVVWMRRLPDASMLDRCIAAGDVDMDRLDACIAMLAAFYRAQPAEPVSAHEWRSRIASRIAANRVALRDPAAGLWRAEVDRICAAQDQFLAGMGPLFEHRVVARRIVEGHGDLRPEHLCLADPPQVIDCLDFSRELRVVDTVEEVAFLALECERLGAADLGADILDMYREASGDDSPGGIVEFYKAMHAGVRARLAVWHMAEPGAAGAHAWAARAKDYLRLAARHTAMLPNHVTPA